MRPETCRSHPAASRLDTQADRSSRDDQRQAAHETTRLFRALGLRPVVSRLDGLALLGTPDLLGPLLGISGGLIVGIDPKHLLWPSPQRAGWTPA